MAIDAGYITSEDVLRFLDEDAAFFDATSHLTISKDSISNFRIIAKNEIPAVLCGMGILSIALQAYGLPFSVNILTDDGRVVQKGEVLCMGRANTRALLAVERTVLNLIQHLSGVATNVFNTKLALGDPRIQILDTRKTIPGLRKMQKYAVLVGGGMNHRFSLGDVILIKDNHIAACGGDILLAVERCLGANKKIEVECDTLRQVRLVANSAVDVIMLDNMSVVEIRDAVSVIRGFGRLIKIEVSGGVTSANISQYRGLDIDFISLGSLTHSVAAVDISLDVI